MVYRKFYPYLSTATPLINRCYYYLPLSGTFGKLGMITGSRTKKWTIFQVHNAVKVDIAANSLCLQQDDEQVAFAIDAQAAGHDN